jgi:hypothetical protein
MGPEGPGVYMPITCDGERLVDLFANKGSEEDRKLKNGWWYRVDFHVKLDEPGSCVDKNGNGRFDTTGECNGVVEIWVDGTQVVEYRDVYMGGNSTAKTINGFMWQHYFRTGGQTFAGTMNEYRDNLVIMGGPRSGPIGAAEGEPECRGVKDPSSPYWTDVYKEWFAFGTDGQRLRSSADCANSLIGDPDPAGMVGGTWKFVDNPAANTTVSHCADRVTRNTAAELTTHTGRDVAGVSVHPAVIGKTRVVNGNLYLDPATFPAAKGAALMGYVKWSPIGRNYLAMGVDAQNHPALYLQTEGATGAAPVRLAVNSSVTVPTGQWMRVEVRAGDDGSVSALIDGVEVVSATGAGDFPWYIPLPWSYHFGIADHLENSGSLRVFVDDISTGTTSFHDCYGWHPEFCPF